MALDNDEFEFPDEKEVHIVGKDDVKVTADSDIEIDVIDDTPPKDRNRERMPKEMVEELEKDAEKYLGVQL